MLSIVGCFNGSENSVLYPVWGSSINVYSDIADHKIIDKIEEPRLIEILGHKEDYYQIEYSSREKKMAGWINAIYVIAPPFNRGITHTATYLYASANFLHQTDILVLADTKFRVLEENPDSYRIKFSFSGSLQEGYIRKRDCIVFGVPDSLADFPLANRNPVYKLKETFNSWIGWL